MSDYYYLDCKRHEQAVFITNNKGDPPNREDIIYFLIHHGHGRECQVNLESEHTIEHSHIKNFKDFIKRRLNDQKIQ